MPRVVVKLTLPLANELQARISLATSCPRCDNLSGRITTTAKGLEQIGPCPCSSPTEPLASCPYKTLTNGPVWELLAGTFGVEVDEANPLVMGALTGLEQLAIVTVALNLIKWVGAPLGLTAPVIEVGL